MRITKEKKYRVDQSLSIPSIPLTKNKTKGDHKTDGRNIDGFLVCRLSYI